jgi:hypothetical protein
LVDTSMPANLKSFASLRRGGDLQLVVLHGPHATVDGETGERAVVERSRGLDVALSVQVAGLRIARTAVLVAPGGIALTHKAQLAERLTITRRIGRAALVHRARRVSAVACRQRIQELGERRL